MVQNMLDFDHRTGRYGFRTLPKPPVLPTSAPLAAAFSAATFPYQP
jgi:hypothetical protein